MWYTGMSSGVVKNMPVARKAPRLLPTIGKHAIIGRSTIASMQASKNLNLPNTVYGIENIDACYTVDNLTGYVYIFQFTQNV